MAQAIYLGDAEGAFAARPIEVKPLLLELLAIAAEIAPYDVLCRTARYVCAVYPCDLDNNPSVQRNIEAIITELAKYKAECLDHCEACEAIEPNLPKLLREKSPHAMCVLRRAIESRPTADAVREVFDLFADKFLLDMKDILLAHRLVCEQTGGHGAVFLYAAARHISLSA